MASLTVTIKRRTKNTNIPQELLEEATRRIGSAFNSSGEPIKGLTFDEEKLILPRLLGIQQSDPSYYKRSSDYFLNLGIAVPKEGVTLEVGTDDNGCFSIAISPHHSMNLINNKPFPQDSILLFRNNHLLIVKNHLP